MGLWGFCKVTTLARLGKSMSKEGSVDLERTIRLYETFALALVPDGVVLTPVVVVVSMVPLGADRPSVSRRHLASGAMRCGVCRTWACGVDVVTHASTEWQRSNPLRLNSDRVRHANKSLRLVDSASIHITRRTTSIPHYPHYPHSHP